MPELSVVVLSNAAQLAAFENRFDRQSFVIYCDSNAFSKILLAHNIPHTLLDDFTIRQYWETVNTWGCSKAYEWIHFCREKKLFPSFDIPSATALYFSHLLIQGLKNYLFCDLIMQSKPGGIVIFPQSPPIYPRFSGNSYLNYFLKEAALHGQINLEEIAIKKGAPQKLSWRGKFKNILKTIIAFTCKPQPVKRIAIGSLKHLESVLRELKTRKESVGFYDTEFHWDLFKRVRKLGIPYYFPENFSLLEHSPHLPSETRMNQELQSAVLAAGQARFFTWKDKDLLLFVNDMIFKAFELWIHALILDLKKYDALFSQIQPAQIISEEDYALRGGPLAAYAKTHAIDFFTISHANTAVDFSVSESAQCFRQSVATIVNSEQEKNKYIVRGWDPDGFQVLGIPRFDALIKEFENTETKAHDIPNLLYCANTYFQSQTPEDYGYLGLHLVSFDTVVRPSAEAIFKAVEQATCEFVIKPHNPEGLDIWRQKIQVSSLNSRTTLIADKHVPITAYLPQADAMILSYWSTAIIEAVICGVPVIYVDLLNISGQAVADFEKRGYLTIVRSQEELTEMIKTLRIRQRNSAPKDFAIIGYCDGKSTQRVADYLTGVVHGA